MDRQVKHKMIALLQARKEKRFWKKVAGALSAAVVFCTVYALILPAVTLSSDGPICNMAEHVHTDDCYEEVAVTRQICKQELHVHTGGCEDEDGNLICGYADFAAHVHSGICYDAQGALVCTLEEREPHEHTAECFESVLTCEQEEGEGHAHTDACRELTCGQEESEEHSHSEACYTLVCEQEESEGHTHTDACWTSTLTCEKEEILVHAHDEEACYHQPEEGDPEKYLTCGQVEILEHTHTESCFETVTEKVLVCGLTEHEHAAECYPNETEGQEETTAATENTAETTEREALCGLEAHTHEDACYGPANENGEKSLVCGKEAHSHGEVCYQQPENDEGGAAPACGKEAHTHEDACYGPADENGEKSLVCGKEAHAHEEACYGQPTDAGDAEEEKNLTCSRAEHTHTELCYSPDPGGTGTVLTCGLEEHTHSEDCYAPAQGVYTWQDENLTVTLTLPEGTSLPQSAQLRVTPVAEGSEEYDALGQSLAMALAGYPAPAADDALPEDGNVADDGMLTPDRALCRIYPLCIRLEDEAGAELPLEAEAEVAVTFAQPVEEEGVMPSGWSVFRASEDGAQELTDAQVSRAMSEGKRLVTGFTYRTQTLAHVVLAETTGIAALDDSEVLVTDFDVTKLDEREDGYYISLADSRSFISSDAVEGSSVSSLHPANEILGHHLQQWVFEHVEGKKANAYYIRAGSQYLKMEAYTDSDSNVPDGHASLTLAAQSQASEFEVETTESGDRITIKSNEYYLGFVIFANYAFAGCSNDSDVSNYLCFRELQLYTPKTYDTVPGVNHPGTIINLFDYWVYTQDGDDTGISYNKTEDMEAGINSNHELKFLANEPPTTGINGYPGDEKVTTGIVKNTLQDDHYPALADDYGGESLAYLFDPTVTNLYREARRDVQDLLQVDASGYYIYNCKANFAEYDQIKNRFILYANPGVTNGSVTGQFFPFNKMRDVETAACNNPEINHFLGMTMTTRFAQQHGGYTDGTKNQETIFEFHGDDDVWIFIDDVLVADLGGIHGEATVLINFRDGSVTVNGEQQTTLKQAYTEAGKTTEDKDWSGDTYADNTTHVMKFFYLERGGNASNLYLKYNLTEIPVTSISKVNQYGDPVSGATFEVYRSNAAWENLGWAYTGTSNDKGEMIFCDDDGMPLTLTEIHDKFGDHFILKETGVPDGYRLISDEIHLSFQSSSLGVGTVLRCENTYDTGVWAAGTLLTTATATLYPTEGDPITYYSIDSESKELQVKGTLFGVVFKYIGPIENGEATEMDKQENWVPVYGSDAEGYQLVEWSGDASKAIDAACDAARLARAYGEVEFSRSGSGTMQVHFTNLPGDIGTYSRMVNNDKRSRYTLGYYWTSESLDEATSANTKRIYTGAGEGDGTSVTPFNRTFGATIEVPNLNNRFYVQKKDPDGAAAQDEATFAMYEVVEDNGEVYYTAKEDSSVRIKLDDMTRNGTGYQGKAWIGSTEGNYSISETGLITVLVDGKPYTISPAKNADGSELVVTTARGTVSTSGEDGTADFDRLLAANYILREIKAPAGYLLNTEQIKVRVTAHSIYANAGGKDDGVVVSRGPGYLVSTMQQFASKGDIDMTLNWIVGKLRVNTVTSGYEVTEGTWSYLADADGTLSTPAGQALNSYLVYSPDKAGALFNYAQNTDRLATGGNPGTYPSEDRRLSTDVGWSYMEIYQDYDYGKDQVKQGVEYTQLLEKEEDLDEPQPKEISALFSRSVFVQVTDEPITQDLTVKKVDLADDTLLGGAEFVFYKEVNGEKLYYRNTNGSTSWIKESDLQAVKLTTSSGGDTKGTFTLKDIPLGDYWLQEISAPAGYEILQKDPVKVTVAEDGLTLDGVGKADEKEIVTAQQLELTVRNRQEEHPTISLTVEKRWAGNAGDNKPPVTLELYYRVGESGEVKKETWTLDGNKEDEIERPVDDEHTAKFTYNDDGWSGTWTNLPVYSGDAKEENKYHWFIRETPMDGYTATYSAGLVPLTVDGQTIQAAETGKAGASSVTITNIAGYELPETGGPGVGVYYWLGAALLLAAGWYGFWQRSKRGGAGHS